jgi:hypothetical protein
MKVSADADQDEAFALMQSELEEARRRAEALFS